jgi:hypothetical protein
MNDNEAYWLAVEITILGQCTYKMKPCGRCGKSKSHSSHRKKDGTCAFQRRLGCATCGQPKSWVGSSRGAGVVQRDGRP